MTVRIWLCRHCAEENRDVLRMCHWCGRKR